MQLTRLIPFAALAFACVAHAQAPDRTAARRIDVELSSFRFSPDHIVLRHGEAYLLHLTNRSGGGHDFNAKEFFARSTIAPQDRAGVAHGEVELAGGEAADIHLIAPAPGHYAFHCGHFMHAALGMKGTIEVQ